MTNSELRELAGTVNVALADVIAKVGAIRKWSGMILQMTDECPTCVTIIIDEDVTLDYLKTAQKALEDAAKAVPVVP